MRILHVNKFLYRRGGAEAYMLDVAALQRAAGHEVGFFGMDHPDNDVPQPLADTFPSRVELEPPPGGLDGLRASARMVWSPSSRRGMEAAVQRFRPDVVHCHNIYHQLSPSVLRPPRSAGIPVVMTLHDYKLVCPSYQMLDHGSMCDACVGRSTLHAVRRRCKGSLASSAVLAVESGVHRRMDAYASVGVFVAPSRFLAEQVVRGGTARERVEVLNNVVDLADASPSEGPGSWFVYAGRLSAEKGVDDLVTAMGELPAQAHLHVAGDGPERQALEDLAESVAPGRVTFHGHLAGSELAPLVRGAVASVVPSRWYENQPMTVLEAFGAAVPVVATTLGGLPELVTDGVHGLLVPHRDPRALATALGRLWSDRDAAHRMGLAGRARLLAEFNPDQHLAALDGIYGRAAARARPPVAPGARAGQALP